MEIIIGDVTYEVNTKLGTTVIIAKTFKRKYNDVVQRLGTMDIDDMIKFLHCAVKDDITLDEFKDKVYDNLGIGDIGEMIMELVKRIQYPNLTLEEIDERLDEIEKNA